MSLIWGGKNCNEILEILDSKSDGGTLVGTAECLPQSIPGGCKRWIDYFFEESGRLETGLKAQVFSGNVMVSDIVAVSGIFKEGALVRICDKDGVVLGRGLVEFSSRQLQNVVGKDSFQIREVLELSTGDWAADDAAPIAIESDNLLLLKT